MTPRSQNRLIQGLRRRLKSLELKLRARLGTPVITSNYGVRLAANYGDATFRYYAKASYGFFYWNRISAIARPFVFLDIGANQGLYTLCAAQNPQCRHAYAFEPVPAVAALLAQNLALNGVEARATLVRKAVSDSCAQVPIVLSAQHTGGATIAQGNAGDARARTEMIETIDAAALEALVADEGLPIVVKIDVEGHEEVVIAELLKCRFAPRISEIFYEVDEAWVDPARIRARLEEAGFGCTRIGRKAHYDVLAERPAR